MLKQFIPISFLLIFLVGWGCDLYPQDEFEENYIVESYLVANRTLPQVRVSTTLPIDEEYLFSKAAVNDANVEVRLLDEAGTAVQTFLYDFEEAGVYTTDDPHTVIPERRYQLMVTFGNSIDTVTSTTFVPGDFSVDEEAVVDNIAYQDPDQVVINTTRSFYPGRQTFFIFTVEAASPDSVNLTPFYADQLSNEDTELESFYKNSSGIINEENYEENEDGTLTLRLPWLAVAFYGNNLIISNAIDDNMYDFYRSRDIQGGGSTLSPGEFQNVIYNIDGGIGVFGSMASDTVLVTVLKGQPG